MYRINGNRMQKRASKVGMQVQSEVETDTRAGSWLVDRQTNERVPDAGRSATCVKWFEDVAKDGEGNAALCGMTSELLQPTDQSGTETTVSLPCFATQLVNECQCQREKYEGKVKLCQAKAWCWSSRSHRAPELDATRPCLARERARSQSAAAPTTRLAHAKSRLSWITFSTGRPCCGPLAPLNTSHHHSPLTTHPPRTSAFPCDIPAMPDPACT